MSDLARLATSKRFSTSTNSDVSRNVEFLAMCKQACECYPFPGFVPPARDTFNQIRDHSGHQGVYSTCCSRRVRSYEQNRSQKPKNGTLDQCSSLFTLTNTLAPAMIATQRRNHHHRHTSAYEDHLITGFAPTKQQTNLWNTWLDAGTQRSSVGTLP